MLNLICTSTHIVSFDIILKSINHQSAWGTRGFVIVTITFASASNIAIIVLMALGVVLSFDSMISLVGSLGILAAIILLVIALAISYLMGGSDPGVERVMGLGTAQVNISAALVVAAQNFDADVITYLIGFAVIGFIILYPAAGELGKRMKRMEEEAAA